MSMGIILCEGRTDQSLLGSGRSEVAIILLKQFSVSLTEKQENI